jgi:hypothetical protein
MTWSRRVRALTIPALLLMLAMSSRPATAQTTQGSPSAGEKYPAFPSEIPDTFTQVTSSFDYEKRDVMIPMRDGVKLHAVIVIPKGAKNAPILLSRTPYNASQRASQVASPSMARILGTQDATDVVVQGGYIRVFEDVRGKYGSEGDYVMARPLHGPLNPTPVDHATDTYDTIDWLVKNLPESNGKVGILGISYDGFTTLMAMFNPHPALKVVVPMNPMVDGWMGDDWFHNGAFREQMMLYFQLQEAARRANGPPWWTGYADDYDAYLAAGSAGEMGRLHGLEQTGMWRKVLAHPAYDEFWQDQAVDKLLAAQPLKVPVLLVDGLWDQEDIYGAPAVYRAIKPKDTQNDMVFLVLGPWHHGQQIREGSSLGALTFPTDTALDFRRNVLAPFLAQYLKDGAPKADIAPVTAYETGTNQWLRLPAWPAGCPSGCTITPSPLYLEPGLKLSFTAPQNANQQYEEYVSDPAKPVPYLVRPVRPFGYGETWPTWLVTDQREPAARPDVLSFISDKLTQPVKIAGQPMVHLTASTSGSDSDWVVKLIDVYPDEVASDPKMGGYELMVAADIFRGRYRESFSEPKAITPDKPLLYQFALPTADHVFLPGHRIMVQIQSSWFPLYDRNPQTFVPSIFWAKPADYKKTVQRIYVAPGEETFIEMPVVR